MSRERSHTAPQETFARVLVYESGGELGLSPKYLESVITQKKRSTIRDGVLVFPPDCELQLRFSRGTPRLGARITNYRVKRLKDLSQEEVESDGFKAKDELLAELHRFYPLITDDSIITVVNFTLATPAKVANAFESKAAEACGSQARSKRMSRRTS